MGAGELQLQKGNDERNGTVRVITGLSSGSVENRQMTCSWVATSEGTDWEIRAESFICKKKHEFGGLNL